MSEAGNEQAILQPTLTAVEQLEPKINIWYLDDGNLADNYKSVLRNLKGTLKSEQSYCLRLNNEKGRSMFFLGPTTSRQYNSISTQFRNNIFKKYI